MVTNLLVVPMHLMRSFSVPNTSSAASSFLSWAPAVPACTKQHFMHHRLQVDGPVDDVKKDVGSRKDDPWVLVYGMGVYPDVHVASRCLHLACDLWVVQCHLGQNSFLAAPVFWQPIISCDVDICGPISSDLGVDHHFIRVANAACTWKLAKNTRRVRNYSRLSIIINKWIPPICMIVCTLMAFK